MKLTIEQALKQGVTLHNEGMLQDAERLYRTILQSQPKHPDANHNLGLIALSMNKPDEALILFETALKANPKIEHLWLTYIKALIKLKKFENAKQLLEQAKKQNLSAENLYFMDAQINQNMGKLDKAEASYIKALELKSDYAEAHNSLGNIFKDLGRLDEAEACYRKAIASRIGYCEAHENLAKILRELGRIEEAIDSDRYTLFLRSSNVEETKHKEPSDDLSFKYPSPLEYPAFYREGMGTENTGSFLRAMALMLRPNRILEIGAGYTTPFLLEAIVNNQRVFDDGNLQESYFENYTYEPKLVVIDNMSHGELAEKPGMKGILMSKYTDFVEGNFEDKANILSEKYGNFDFVWFDCGSASEYKIFMEKYWDMCSDYIFFHYTYSEGIPNLNHHIILENIKGNPFIFDIVEPHKKRQGSITMIKKNDSL
tara:strand:+ start:69 stop:1355 length:1287 start_codon:yes stop_codon:yes gene_type:complete